jgi:ATP synthase protein I
MFSGNHSGTVQVVIAQAGLALISALIGAATVGAAAGLALLYGGLVAMAASVVLVWRERQAMQHPEWDPHRLFRLFVRAGVERMLLLVGLLAVGLGVLKLAPLPLMLGLVLAQLAWLALATGRNTK